MPAAVERILQQQALEMDAAKREGVSRLRLELEFSEKLRRSRIYVLAERIAQEAFPPKMANKLS